MKKLLGVLLQCLCIDFNWVRKQEAPATDAAQTKDANGLQTVTMASTGSDADVVALYRDPA